MDKILKWSVLLYFAILAGCVQKISAPASTGEKKYSEDLAAFRPEIPEYRESYTDSAELEITEQQFITPVLDVTDEMRVLLDSIHKVNMGTEYYEYTVLVHIGNNRVEADQARLDVIRVLPETQPELEYKSPSYRVKVGRYFNNVAAYQTYIKLRETFLNAIIVPERVYFR